MKPCFNIATGTLHKIIMLFALVNGRSSLTFFLCLSLVSSTIYSSISFRASSSFGIHCTARLGSIQTTLHAFMHACMSFRTSHVAMFQRLTLQKHLLLLYSWVTAFYESTQLQTMSTVRMRTPPVVNQRPKLRGFKKIHVFRLSSSFIETSIDTPVAAYGNVKSA